MKPGETAREKNKHIKQMNRRKCKERVAVTPCKQQMAERGETYSWYGKKMDSRSCNEKAHSFCFMMSVLTGLFYFPAL